MAQVVFEIQRRNRTTKRNFSTKDVTIGHDPIKSLLTDGMKLLIRSLYDRGIMSKGSTLEGTTAYNFEQQVEERKKEMDENLDEIMKAPVIMNQDNKATPDNRNVDPNLEQSPSKKKSEKDVQARTESLTKTQADVFMTAFKRCEDKCEMMDVDEDFKYNTSFEFAEIALNTYLNDSIRKNADLPDEILALDSKQQMAFRKSFNQSLKNGYTLSEAIDEANKVI